MRLDACCDAVTLVCCHCYADITSYVLLWRCLNAPLLPLFNGYTSRGYARLLGGVMVAVFLKYPHLLDEAPGLGDLKTAPPRQGDYVSYTLL